MSALKRNQTGKYKHTIPAVTKTLELIRLLASGIRSDTTIKALSTSLEIPRTTCYRILRSLIASGWAQRSDDGYHTLSLGLLPVLEPFRREQHIAELVMPALSALAYRAEMTAKLSVRQGDYAVTIARGDSPQQTSVALQLGGSFHLAYGASGSIFLSELDPDEVQNILTRAPDECWKYQKPPDVMKRIKEFLAKGWCADLGKFNPNINTISVPLRDVRSEIIAAMTLIGFPHEFRTNRLPSLTKAIAEGARQAEKALRI